MRRRDQLHALIRPAGHVALAGVMVAGGVVKFGSVTAVASLCGAATGGAAFCALSAIQSRTFSVLRFGRIPISRLLVVAFALGLIGSGEEVVWRGFVLEHLRPATGWFFAFLVSSIGFALAHVGGQGRRAVYQVVTGMAFGGIFLATGSLCSAIAAHVVFNVLVAAAHKSTLTSPKSEPDTDLPPTPARRGIGCHPTVRHEVASLESVWKSYGEVDALRDVTLTVAHGELVALLGENGAGKSTAMKILLGAKAPDAGRATLMGADPRTAAARRYVGAMPQEISFPATLEVEEIVRYTQAHFDRREPMESLLGAFGLDHVRYRHAVSLSGGEKRRLAVALAFAGKPDVVFLDEPSAGLDVGSRVRVWEAIRAQARRGGTVFMSTHYLEEAEHLATRVIILAGGQVIADAPIEDVRREVGGSRVTFLSATPPPLADVYDVASDGDLFTLVTRDPDETVRRLVAADVRFRRLEIRQQSLEEAFMSLLAKRPSQDLSAGEE